MKCFSILAVMVLIGVTALAQVPDAAALQKTDAGKRVIAYFDAYNSGDDGTLGKFFADNVAADSLKQRPVEPRLAFHRRVRSDFGSIKISKVISVTAGEIKVQGKAGNGALIDYAFQLSVDGKIASMTIDPGAESAASPAVTQAAAAPATAADLSASLEDLFGGLARSGEFSGVVLVAKDGKPLFNRAYGLADIANKVPNRLDTKFNLGSINKMFTRVAIGQMVKAGKLSFSDKLIKVLPDYPNRDVAEKITIGQIVTMTSGLGDIFTDSYFAMDGHKVRSLKDYLPLFADKPLEFEPGTSNRYSNAGYVVLGIVIEKLSGKSYYDYVRENVFAPAGMRDSDSYEIDKLPANTATGYMKKGTPERVPNPPALPGRGSSAGGGYSTADDLLRFVAALTANKLVVPNDDGTLPTEFKGFGFAGGSEGINGILMSNPKTGYTIVVLSNFDPPSAEAPGMMVRDWIKQLKQ
ncbi:MAG TPA: serine hydrolase domain-containing protein [Pyrinomonadaceae bacterium]|jgi:CubicO group peptidase (beta-lactamase class C family)|nr:serine hydrolase domain-containing protein [Pyrinomonadaceae bacterium]